MNFGNFGQNPSMDPDIEKLIQLFKKILKKHPKYVEQLAKMAETNAINLNICFMTLVPMTADELDELNEMYDEWLSRNESTAQSRDGSELEFKLTRDDVNFLKNHGLQF